MTTTLPSALTVGQTVVLAYDPGYLDGDPVQAVLVVEVDADSALVDPLDGTDAWSVCDSEARRGLVEVRS